LYAAEACGTWARMVNKTAILAKLNKEDLQRLCQSKLKLISGKRISVFEFGSVLAMSVAKANSE
jgi:hypothetical protein